MLRNWKMSRLLSVAVMMLVQSITTGVCASSKKGDVNHDGSITMADANAVVNYFLSTDKPEDFDKTIADVNGDGSITMADANMIVNIFLNQIVYVPVDLGLSVKWATCNVGASDPWEYGDYFAWGETEKKERFTYNWETYKWSEGDYHNLTKYVPSSYYDGIVDNKSSLDPEDDAAFVNMGDGWRMPTEVEVEELITKCTWTWYKYRNTKYGGKQGYEVTGTNGNSIFLPAGGYSDRGTERNQGTEGEYWTSSLVTSSSNNAYSYLDARLLNFRSSYIYNSRETRFIGACVRGVYTK